MMANCIPTQEAAVVRRSRRRYDHDQFEIQSQRASETTWTTIAYDTSSPYLDSRAPLVAGQPDSRRDRARYRDNDDPVGEWSDTVEVTAASQQTLV